MKEKIDKLDFIKIKNFSVEDTIKGLEDKPHWEKIFATSIYHKGLLFKIIQRTLKTQQYENKQAKQVKK